MMWIDKEALIDLGLKMVILAIIIGSFATLVVMAMPDCPACTCNPAACNPAACNYNPAPCICNETLICEEVNISFMPNNIQSAHNDIDFELNSTDNTLIIYDVDDWGTIYGFSMTPTIFDDNVVIDKEYNNGDELIEGMIIRFKNKDGDYTIHRIKGVYEDYVVTQGDANEGDDGRIDNNDITHIIIGVLFT